MSDSKQPLVLAIDLKSNVELGATSFSWFNDQEISLEQIDLIPVKTKDSANALRQVIDGWEDYRGDDLSSRFEDDDPLYQMAPSYVHINSTMIKPVSGELIIESDEVDNMASQILPFTFEIQHLGESIGVLSGAFSLDGYLEIEEDYQNELEVSLTIDAVGLAPEYRDQGVGRAMVTHISDYFGKILNKSMAGMDRDYVALYKIVPTIEAEAYSRSGYNLLDIMTDEWENSVNIALQDAVGLEAEEANFSVGL